MCVCVCNFSPRWIFISTNNSFCSSPRPLVPSSPRILSCGRYRRAIACNACETIQRIYRGYVGRLTATFLRDLQAKIIISQACAPKPYSSTLVPSRHRHSCHTSLYPHLLFRHVPRINPPYASGGIVIVSLSYALSSVSCQRRSFFNKDDETIWLWLCMQAVSIKPTFSYDCRSFLSSFYTVTVFSSCKSLELGSLPRVQATEAVCEVDATEARSGYQLAEYRTRISRT